MCVCVTGCLLTTVQGHMWTGQRTALGSQLSSSTFAGVQGIECHSSGLLDISILFMHGIIFAALHNTPESYIQIMRNKCAFLLCDLYFLGYQDWAKPRNWMLRQISHFHFLNLAYSVTKKVPKHIESLSPLGCLPIKSIWWFFSFVPINT